MGVADIKKRVQRVAPSLPHSDHISKIFLFGSFLHGSESDDSDIDLIIDLFEPVSFFQLYDIQETLEKELGVDVDLVTPQGLSHFIRDDVLHEAELLYER